MKIKCFRFDCAQCGETASIQVFFRKDGSVGYARARHKNSEGFFYHQQPVEYTLEKIRQLNILDQGQSSTKRIDQNKPKISSELDLLGGGM